MERTILSLSGALILAFSAMAQLPGSVDMSFNASDQGYGFGDGVNYTALTVCRAMQTDGKLLVGNNWWMDGSEPAAMRRLHPDGTIDPTFTTSSDGNVYAAAIQPDGKIVAVGSFTTYGGIPRNHIVRLNSNGTVDTSFDPGSGADEPVFGVALQTNGKIIVHGPFDTIHGIARNSIARLNADGSLDAGFDPGVAAAGTVKAVTIQPDGKILIGGDFTSVGGVSRGRIARLNTNGNVDVGFVPNSGLYNGFNGEVSCITLTGTGSMLVGGSFTSYRGSSHNRIIMLTSSAGVAATFDSGTGFDGTTYRIASTLDGSWLVAGSFSTYQGWPSGSVIKLSPDGSIFSGFSVDCRVDVDPFAFLDSGSILVASDGAIYLAGDNAYDRGLIRLNPDGTLDPAFRNGVGTGVNILGYGNGGVRDIIHQVDGRVILVGEFSKYNGVPQRSIVRLYPSGSVDLGFGNGEGASLGSCGPPAQLLAVALQADAKILVGVDPQTYINAPLLYDGDTVHSSIFRLLSNGDLDPSFDCDVTGEVHRIRVQPDGKIILVGALHVSFNTTTISVLRLNSNGDVDGTFAHIYVTSPSYNAPLIDAAVLPSGKLLVASTVVERYNANGTKDYSFADGTTGLWPFGIPSGVHNVHLRPSGKVVLTGAFGTYNGLPYSGVVQINADGTIDPSFDPGSGVEGWAHPLACTPCNRMESVLQPDGKLILGNLVGGFDGHSVTGLVARLHEDGSFDEGYSVGTGPEFHPFQEVYDAYRVATLHLDHLGRLYVGGSFTGFSGVGRNRIVRLHGGNRLTPAVSTLLEGAYNPSTLDHWTDLWFLADFPLVEPYSAMGYQHAGDGGGEATTFAILSNAQGPTRILDWVVVELRDANDPQQIVATRSALLRKDGNTVDVDGWSPIHFDVEGSNYFVSIHHRNHLGVMTQTALDLDQYNGVIVDFRSPNTQTYGTEARKDINGVLVQWAGDANSDGNLKYTGSSNDRDPILTSIGGISPTQTTSGYLKEDVNLDGVVKYTGTYNDRDPIIQNIGGISPTNSRQAQLP